MKQLTTKEFIEKVNSKHNYYYDYSKVNYINSITKITIICPIHGEFEQTPGKHLLGQGCPKCKGTTRKTTEQFIKEAKLIHGNKYDYSKTKYGKNNRTPVEIICSKHGSFWQTPVHHLTCRCGCPLCNTSHGEQILLNYFKDKQFKYVRQYEIKVPTNIRNSGIIKVDFYLPEYNTIVEYNGIQHYKMQYYFGGDLKFNSQLIRDNYLRNYCKENKINLIEISYKEKDIINYINKKLYV